MKTLREKMDAGQQLLIAAIQFQQEGEDNFAVSPLLDEAGFDTDQLLHIVGDGVFGLYDQATHATDMKRYLALSKERSTILYANAHCVNEADITAHPEWATRAQDGSLVSVYGTYTRVCINSPWRDFFLATIRTMTELPIEGVFLDGPTIVQEGCFCPDCQRLFSEMYGHSLAEATEHELTAFKVFHVKRYLSDVRSAIAERGRDIVLYNNCSQPDNMVDCSIDDVYEHIDLLGTEGGFNFYVNPNEISIWKASICAKYLESKAYGKPYVIFCAGNHQPWARAMHTADENRLLFASTMAHGASMWYGIHGPISQFQEPGGRAGLECNRFFADHMAYYTATKRVSDVALVWSKPTVRAFPEQTAETDFTNQTQRTTHADYGAFQKEFHGFYDALTRAHSQFSMIDEENLMHDELSGYRVIVLPNTICLSQAAADRLKDYVNQGGILIATRASGFCDEEGAPYATPVLAELLGMQTAPRFVQYEAGCGYLKLQKETLGIHCNHDYLESFAGGVVQTDYAADAEIWASVSLPMAGRYAQYNPDLMPAIVSRTVGLGRVVYVAGGIGETWKRLGPADLKHLIANLVGSFSGALCQVEGAYESVEVLLREQGTRKILHFVNYTGAMQRPIDGIIPCRGVRVTLAAEHVSKVYSLWDAKPLPFTQKDGNVTFTVDVPGAYEAVVIE